jgi:hypothetical protein
MSALVVRFATVYVADLKLWVMLRDIRFVNALGDGGRVGGAES